MSWSVEFLEEAKKDIQKLERSATIQVFKKLNSAIWEFE